MRWRSTATSRRVSASARSTTSRRGGLPHVVNYELPTVPQDYIHRIGRTGRAGMEGDAVSLVCIDERDLLEEIERLLRGPIPWEVVQGFEPDRRVLAEPIPELTRGGR